jgi:hypothetical protein
MVPHEDLIRFAKQNRGRPLLYRRMPNGPFSPEHRYEVYGERTYNGMLQILTFFLDAVVWINICPMRNPRINT